jgi:hypothetical protein
MSTAAPEYDVDAARAAGVQVEQEVYEDYFGTQDVIETFFLPDGKQYIQFRPMNEGARSRFQKMTNRDVVLERSTGNARMKVDPATERHELIVASVIGWNLMRKTDNGWQPVTFSSGSPGANLEQWLDKAPVRIVDDLEKAIRKANPWLLSELTVEEIDKEMDNLREQREELIRRQQGEASSSSR